MNHRKQSNHGILHTLLNKATRDVLPYHICYQTKQPGMLCHTTHIIKQNNHGSSVTSHQTGHILKWGNICNHILHLPHPNKKVK